MSNRRKANATPRKPRFPVDSLPPEIADMVRAVAKSEKTTLSQASLAALVVLSDLLGDGVQVLAEGVDPGNLPVDIELLVPDPADRRGVRRAYVALVDSMPLEARQRVGRSQEAREIAAGNMTVISRGDAVGQLADHIRGASAYIVAAGPGQVASALRRLPPVSQDSTAYLDRGDGETVMIARGRALAVMPEVIEAAAGPVAGILVIPKTVPAKRIGKALGQDIAADGHQDMIMLTTAGAKLMNYPSVMLEALALVDPQAAMQIRVAERDLIASFLPPAVGAMLDQADAAGAHGMRILGRLAEHLGGEVQLTRPPAIVQEIAAGLLERVARGGLDLCPHLSPAAPVPAFWLPYAPEQIRCVNCNAETGRIVTGTAEDRTCDRCRRDSDQIFNGVAQLPPVVSALPGLPGGIGPIAVMYGLCADCHSEAYPDRSQR